MAKGKLIEKNTDKELVKVVVSEQVSENTTNVIVGSFNDFVSEISAIEKEVLKIKVTSETQKDLIREAKEKRLFLKEVRINADKKRKELKEETNKYNKAVQSAYNYIESKIKPLEEHLYEQEKFIERIKEQRKKELLEKRQQLIQPYITFFPVGIDIAGLSDDDFTKMLDFSKMQYENYLKIEKEREEERKKKEQEEKLAQKNNPPVAVVTEQELIKKAEKLEQEKIAFEMQKKSTSFVQDFTDINVKNKKQEKKVMTEWVDSFIAPKISHVNPTIKEIEAKFELFKKWAKELIEKQ